METSAPPSLMSAAPDSLRRRAEDLPVDPDRLRREFPELEDDDLAAYVEITRRILSAHRSRPRTTRDVMERAWAAERKQAAGQPLTPDEALAVRYLRALTKMQRSTVRRP